jgi:hypothetical protein
MLVQVRIRAIFATSPSKIYNQAVERVCLLSNSAQNQKSVPQQPSKPHNLIVLGPDSYILKFLYIKIEMAFLALRQTIKCMVSQQVTERSPWAKRLIDKLGEVL